jgi:hypothetical protein
LVSQAKRDGSRLVQLTDQRVDARWLALADLGQYAALQKNRLPDTIEDRAAELARQAIRNGFRRIAVTTLGATLHEDFDVPARSMLEGLRSLEGRSALQWFETNPSRFAALRELLSKDPRVALTVSEARQATVAVPVTLKNDAILFVRRTNTEVVSTLLLPGGAATSPEHVSPLSEQELRQLNRTDGQPTPTFADHTSIGPKVTALVLGDVGEKLLLKGEGIDRLIIQHDMESASIPFEALALEGRQPALKKGIVRRPSYRGLTLTDRPQKPAHKDRVKVALVIGSTKNLENAPAEADAIRTALVTQDVLLDDTRKKATRAQALDALRDASVDILHFVGHASFKGSDGSQGGLDCDDGKLTLDDIRGEPIGPRIVFFNACESVRLRGEAEVVQGPEAARAFAEYVLLSGVEAFVGTFWPVRDGAAAHFSARVYGLLAKGEQLSDAVAQARQFLFDNGRADWANYALYGNGSFRIKEPS